MIYVLKIVIVAIVVILILHYPARTCATGVKYYWLGCQYSLYVGLTGIVRMLIQKSTGMVPPF